MYTPFLTVNLFHVFYQTFSTPTPVTACVYHKFACFLQQIGMEIISILAPLPEKKFCAKPSAKSRFPSIEDFRFFELLAWSMATLVIARDTFLTLQWRKKGCCPVLYPESPLLARKNLFRHRVFGEGGGGCCKMMHNLFFLSVRRDTEGDKKSIPLLHQKDKEHMLLDKQYGFLYKILVISSYMYIVYINCKPNWLNEIISKVKLQQNRSLH